jgi:DnaD/phage-associated family protein
MTRVSDSNTRSETTAAPFEGFRTGAPAVTLPAQFFAELLPQIVDPAELRVTLAALFAIQRRRGALRAVRRSELAAEPALLGALEWHGGGAAIEGALAAAVARGGLLSCALEDGDELIFINHAAGRRQLERVRSGALDAPGAAPSARTASTVQSPSRPAAVYEQEIGALTPTVSGALAEAEERFPADWIVEAIREAALQNARSWRYAAAILDRWETEGRDDAAPGRDPGPAADDAYERVVRRSYDGHD